MKQKQTPLRRRLVQIGGNAARVGGLVLLQRLAGNEGAAGILATAALVHRRINIARKAVVGPKLPTLSGAAANRE